MALTTTVGCGGCSKDAAKKDGKNGKDAKAEEKEKIPLDVGRVTPLLSESIVDVDAGRPLALVKPGHWTATVQRMQSNVADLEGRTTLAAVDAKGQPLPLDHLPFNLTASRPAVLAKGRPKRVECELFVPPTTERPRIVAELSDSTTGVVLRRARQAWTAMPSNQYFLVVLAKEPARYNYLKFTDTVRAPFEVEDATNSPHYRVVLADATKSLPLPPQVLQWTSVAFVVWDEVNPDRLDPAQRQALVDWIHWGGRLIINGPDSLAALRGSYLGPYLPADPGKTRSISASDLATFNNRWTTRAQGARVEPLAPKKAWSGVELNLRPGARFLPGADGLLCECDVGAGSVVVSGMRLTERELVNWRGFDGLLNGALLRRPPRVFRSAEGIGWSGLQADWAKFKNRARDAYFTTPLRWFARDAEAKANVRRVSTTPTAPNQGAFPYGQPMAEVHDQADQPGGLGQWNEYGAVSTAARESLRDAAGVRVPGAVFVLSCLGIYLFVLVPLNWMVFHALGRVEWAWIAAPIIAIVGTLAVVRQAQLDIGFVRAQTEIALLELHGDYPRGHLSRFAALYSSLSTIYEMDFDDPTAVATPFPSDDEYVIPLGDAPQPVALEAYDKPRLRGLATSSASTTFVHVEQMHELAGPLRLSSPRANSTLLEFENKSQYDLADAAIVRRKLDGAGEPTFEGCWLGPVNRGASTLLRWSPVAMRRTVLPFTAEREQAAKLLTRKRLDLDRLLGLAYEFPAPRDPLQGRREEYRLVARIDAVLPGTEISPDASQTTGATVVLAHLRLGPPPDQEPDENSPADVAPTRTQGPSENSEE